MCPQCPLCADFVANVFLGCRTKILGAADAFCARRCEGPYRSIQNRSRTSVATLKSDAAAETSKDQLSRDFRVVRFSTFATKSAMNGLMHRSKCSRHFLRGYIEIGPRHRALPRPRLAKAKSLRQIRFWQNHRWLRCSPHFQI
jgi:hypothetical protein